MLKIVYKLFNMKLNKRFSIYKHKKVLVTGHNGFVGSWLTASLLKLKSQVFGISLKNKNNGFKYIVDKNDPNLTEIQQNKILAEFPDADFSIGKFGFTKTTNNTKLARVKAFIKRGYKPKFKTLPLKVQDQIKEKLLINHWDLDDLWQTPMSLAQGDFVVKPYNMTVDDLHIWREKFDNMRHKYWTTNPLKKGSPIIPRRDYGTKSASMYESVIYDNKI